MGGEARSMHQAPIDSGRKKPLRHGTRARNARTRNAKQRRQLRLMYRFQYTTSENAIVIKKRWEQQEKAGETESHRKDGMRRSRWMYAHA